MPRRRMIDPEIWFNEKFAKLPDPARLLFIGIFSNADDDGRLQASPKYLKAHIFPYDDDKGTREIKQFRDLCVKLGLITIYSVNGSEYPSYQDGLSTSKSERTVINQVLYLARTEA